MTSRSRTPRGARRSRQWGTNLANFTLSTTSVAIDLQAELESDLGFNLHNTTIGAIRTTLDMHFAAGSTVGDQTMLYFGILWFNNEAVAAGGASLPNPTHTQADWIMHGSRLLISESTALHQPRNAHMDFFSDSQRKQRENNSTLVLIGTASLADHGVQCFVGGRVLFLLP